ncbi:uncharacterized protein LOC118647604 [Monomorium pharaonis]|uniref:uncharacterized protein LOC118647604 n=1 Tax=Monomorium pharaonis TaxID=307658 RepID=UPI00174695DC|nr:uncharacterized protein LOC118647604 [Monomorium pharaonis]XP_036148698.1 uncharacterized protein LOC118647604 [Monomorium pharaonis]
MKAFVLIICSLITVVYAADIKLKTVTSVLKKCVNPENLPEDKIDVEEVKKRSDILPCLFKNLGMIDENGALMDEKVLEFCETVVKNIDGSCDKIAAKCFEEENQSLKSDSEKTQAKLNCIRTSDTNFSFNLLFLTVYIIRPKLDSK